MTDWAKATANLQARRDLGTQATNDILSDYRSHLVKAGYGSTVLDVGCGSQYLKTVLPKDVKYIGLDAFPIEGVDCIHSAIEDLKGWEFDTVVAFAVLDNCRDFKQACEVMKQTAKKNIVILTGIGIEVDQYHTFKLEMSDFDEAFKDMKCTYKQELTPKVWLLNYQK